MVLVDTCFASFCNIGNVDFPLNLIEDLDLTSSSKYCFCHRIGGFLARTRYKDGGFGGKRIESSAEEL